MEGLPINGKCYYSLINFAISDKNYEHFLTVWKAFKMNTVKDSHDLYLKVDVLLLACVFKTKRKESIHSFQLDTVYFFTPGYGGGEIPRFTDVNLKLISIMGVISMIWKGYAEANNKYLNVYNGNKSTSYTIFWDLKIFYEHSMMHFLSTQMLDWVNPKDFNLNSYSNDIPIDFFLEIYLYYPDELHDLHNNFPLSGKK